MPIPIQAVIGASLGGWLLWTQLRRPATGGTMDVLPLIGPPAPTPAIGRMANAIARAEGYFVPGSVAARAHNPGNLKLGGTTINGITVYTSADQGWHALYRQLALIRDDRSAFYAPGDTIARMGQVWTATVHEQGAWSANVAHGLGVPVTTTLGEVLA